MKLKARRSVRGDADFCSHLLGKQRHKYEAVEGGSARRITAWTTNRIAIVIMLGGIVVVGALAAA